MLCSSALQTRTSVVAVHRQADGRWAAVEGAHRLICFAGADGSGRTRTRCVHRPSWLARHPERPDTRPAGKAWRRSQPRKRRGLENPSSSAGARLSIQKRHSFGAAELPSQARGFRALRIERSGGAGFAAGSRGRPNPRSGRLRRTAEQSTACRGPGAGLQRPGGLCNLAVLHGGVIGRCTQGQRQGRREGKGRRTLGERGGLRGQRLLLASKPRPPSFACFRGQFRATQPHRHGFR
jgi:hypothetical protein